MKVKTAKTCFCKPQRKLKRRSSYISRSPELHRSQIKSMYSILKPITFSLGLTWKIIRIKSSPLSETPNCRQEVSTPADEYRLCQSVCCCTVSLCISGWLVVGVCYQRWILRGQRRGFVLPRSDVTDPSAESLLQFLQLWKWLLCCTRTTERIYRRWEIKYL